MTIGKRIKKIRKALNLTQQKFADSLGMKQNTVATYEIGRTNPSDPVIKSICREFGVNENWLRTGESNEMFVPAPKSELDALAKRYHLRKKDYALVEKLIGLSKEERDIIFDFMMDVVADASKGGSDPNALMFPGGASVEHNSDEDIDAEAEEAKRLYQRERISEKKPASPASFARESGVG